MPLPQAPILEPSTGIPFDATDFAMNLTSTTGVLVSPCQITMEDWDTEEEEEDDKEEVEVEIDPDLEDDVEESADEDDSDDEGEDDEDEDDAFEQYLFGEDEE